MVHRQTRTLSSVAVRRNRLCAKTPSPEQVSEPGVVATGSLLRNRDCMKTNEVRTVILRLGRGHAPALSADDAQVGTFSKSDITKRTRVLSGKNTPSA